ncbi:hypothetical protein [Aestuariivivens marinum]|uniref:hypothetical protein n=1 Tax=Aestuariivivens marinum TaxID=2913555 RepID=UPI001F584589|nr:hypothetical protein [Aestuariivivens marinum]
MSEKKHIDRLFQEKFKDFEATPSNAVWTNIEAQLEKKKKRRVIPIWWRYAGVAALLVLLLALGSLYFNSGNKIELPTNQVVETESPNAIEKATEDSSKNENNENNLAPSDSEAVIANSKENQIEERNDDFNDNSFLNNNPAKLIKPVVSQNQSAIASEHVEEQGHNKLSKRNNNSKDAETNTPNVVKDNVLQNQDTKIADNNSALNNPRKNTVNDKVSPFKFRETDLGFNVQNTDTSALAQTNTDDKTEPSIEDLIDKDIKELIEEEKFSRWSVAPNAAPVYFNSLGEGSSIDPQFNSNAKTSELNMSYGIKASYAVNKRLRIRSGVNKVRLGYNTNDVVVFQSIGAPENTISAALPNIKSESSNYTLNSVNTSDNMSFASADNFNPKVSSGLLSSATNTSLNQEFGFIEVPLEIQYTLLDKKFGVNVIGGFSSFFLNENKIYSETSSSRTLIGEANNINKVSYSANLGLGLNYKITKQLDLNLEPLFKYQINTFSNTSGNFKPYFIGVYTGFAIKF